MAAMANPFPGLAYMFLCVCNDNKVDVPTAARLIKAAVDAYVVEYESLIKIIKPKP